MTPHYLISVSSHNGRIDGQTKTVCAINFVNTMDVHSRTLTYTRVHLCTLMYVSVKAMRVGQITKNINGKGLL